MANEWRNPYVAGSPIRGEEMFFGRDGVFEWLRSHLIGRFQHNAIVLYGERRTGKTSVLYQIPRRIDDPAFIPVFIDLQQLSLDSVASFFWQFAIKVWGGLRRVQGVGRIERPRQEDFRDAPSVAFSEVFMPQVEAAIGERQLLVMFDEFNRIRAKVNATGRGAKKRVDVDACTFKVDNSLFDTFVAMGYAVASDRLWQMELYRRTARGRLAEIFGPDQLGSDVFMRTIGYSDAEMTAGFAALPPESRAAIAGYVAGINRRIAEISDTPLLPFEFIAVGLSPEDWTVEDVLAWCTLLQRNFDPEALDQAQLDNAALLKYLTEISGSETIAMGMFMDLRWPNDPDAQTYIVDIKPSAAETGDMDGTLRNVPGLEEACDKLKDRRDKIHKNLKKINAKVKMGSYAWVVSGKKTASGNPIIYSGPQMGFSVPSIVCEGSIRAAGLNISGMTVPGIPGIIIGRTPHHAWSMQVGHAHTTDYYFEDLSNVSLNRWETISVAGGADVDLPVFRTENGPVINPLPFNPMDYIPDRDGPIISWRYAHWGYEFNVIQGFLEFALAQSMDEFGEGIEKVAVSQHFCYADRDGNIAYWMSGRDPVRPMDTYLGPYLYFLPQGTLTDAQDWDDDVLVPRSHARNPQRGFFNGWNNKTSPTYFNAFNSNNDIYGPFQRAHVIEEYLAPRNDLTFEEIRDLALNIATTDSFNGGGNPWAFVANEFEEILKAAVPDPNDYPQYDEYRQIALDTLSDWDGHFVDGGPGAWASGNTRPQAWVLMNDWLQDFVYRYQISPLIFLWTILLILIPTALTVSYQSYKAANANPADSIYQE